MSQAQARINELEGALARSGSANETSPETTFLAGQPPANVTGLEPNATFVGQDEEAISPHVGLDESGHVTYHGPTSRFYASSLTDPSPASAATLRETLQRTHTPALESNIELLRHVWQPLLQTKSEQELGMPPKLAERLLDIYWTWQHPLHNCVYKPCRYHFQTVTVPH